MSLPVPLTVRIGDKHITRHVDGLAFRKEAVGGLRSLTFKLAHAATSLPTYLDPLARVDIFDARTAEIVAQGRVTDTGRTTDGSGQSWDVVAFGPAQAASDVTAPKVWIDSGLDGWVPKITAANGSAEAQAGNFPGVEGGAPGLSAKHPEGVSVLYATVPPFGPYQSRAEFIYNRIWHAGNKLAAITATWAAGNNDTTLVVQVMTGASGALTNAAAASGSSTGGGVHTPVVVTNWTDGDDTAALRFAYASVGSGTIPDDTYWAFWSGIVVESVRTTSAGVDILSGYSGSTNPGSIVHDLLGSGFLPAFDGAGSEIAAGTASVTHLAYPEGVNASQVLDDMMALDPAYRWYTEPDRTGDGYVLRWEVWPTTVRYEATLEDGGSFPMSTQTVYNRVSVLWRDTTGALRRTYRTLPCAVLDDAGVIRHSTITMPEGLGNTEAEAQAYGDNYLSENNTPKNGGTLTIARPIRDLILGREVQPFEIEAGELVRVKGVESYADALNADDNDAATVFRIFAMDYTSDGNRAQLTLDADPKTTAAALVKFIKSTARR